MAYDHLLSYAIGPKQTALIETPIVYPGRVQLLGDNWDGMGLPTVERAST